MKNSMKLSTCATLLFAVQITTVQNVAANPTTCTKYGPPTDKDYQWEGVWGDEFNSRTLNTNKWFAAANRIDKQNDPDGGDGTYNDAWFSPDNVKLDGNSLVIENHTNWTNTSEKKQYSGGWLMSKKKFNKGYFEACTRLDWNQLTWSTFWLWQNRKDNPNGPKYPGSANEFDIMEWVGNHYPYHPTQSHHGPFKHTKATTTKNQNLIPRVNNPKRKVNDWHTWGLLWTDNEITFYIDKEKQFTSELHGKARNDFLHLIFSSSPVQKKLMGKGSPVLPRFFVDFVRVYHSHLIN